MLFLIKHIKPLCTFGSIFCYNTWTLFIHLLCRIVLGWAQLGIFISYAFLFLSSLQSLRSLLGEELSEYLASGEQEGKLENVRSRVRLLRDLRLDTRAKAVWARILNDQPSSRRYKGGVKKGGSRGCFGHKIDRIGAVSGLGC
ncbi:ANFC4 protein, partial [Amia calva]|nr:ANFC4 protein [Amia calva]